MYINLLFEEYIIDWNIEKNLLGNTPVPEGNFNVMGLLLLLWIGFSDRLLRQLLKRPSPG